jgi:hypothetical protein
LVVEHKMQMVALVVVLPLTQLFKLQVAEPRARRARGTTVVTVQTRTHAQAGQQNGVAVAVVVPALLVKMLTLVTTTKQEMGEWDSPLSCSPPLLLSSWVLDTSLAVRCISPAVVAVALTLGALLAPVDLVVEQMVLQTRQLHLLMQWLTPAVVAVAVHTTQTEIQAQVTADPV